MHLVQLDILYTWNMQTMAQGSIWVWAPPMRQGFIMQHLLLLAESIPRIIPVVGIKLKSLSLLLIWLIWCGIIGVFTLNQSCSIYILLEEKLFLEFLNHDTHFALFSLINGVMCRDHYGYGFSQWEEALLCNAFPHWPSPCPEWFLMWNVKSSWWM